MKNIKEIVVLIDADNAQSTKMQAMLDEVSTHGQIVIKRAYSDWSKPNMQSWPAILSELAIIPRQQFANTKGKNATDILMIIDAMDFLYRDQFDIFVLVSSDSDFTALASRLKESGVTVFGIGELKTPPAFVNACNQFFDTKDIGAEEDIDKSKANTTNKNKTATEQTNKELSKAISAFTKAWQEYKDDDDWVRLSSAGSYVKRVLPAFNPKSHSATTMTDFIKKTKCFQIETRKEATKNNPKATITYYKRK